MTAQVFTMTARIENVDPLVQRLKDAAETTLSPVRLVGFEIALTEALNNIVLHGMRDLPEATIAVTLALEPGAARVDIDDRGRAAPPDLFTAGRRLQDIDDMAESGRGVPLIMTCADTVDYRSADGVNRLSLRFVDEGDTASGAGTP